MLNNSSKDEPSTPHVQGLKWWILRYVYIDSTNNNLSPPSRILGRLDFVALQVSFVFLVLFDPHFQNNLHSLQIHVYDRRFCKFSASPIAEFSHPQVRLVFLACSRVN